MKGEYAVICDRVLGQGEHQVDILFHPAPVISGQGINKKSRTVKLEVMPKGVVITKEAEHANVAIIPAQGDELKVLDLIAQKDPIRGWFALYAITPSHDIVYRARTNLPRHFETVVQPLPAGDVLPMTAKALEVASDDGRTCAALSCGDDLFLVSYDGPTEMTCGSVRFDGTALLLRSEKPGAAGQAHMVDGRRLRLGAKDVFSSDSPTPARTLELP